MIRTGARMHRKPQARPSLSDRTCNQTSLTSISASVFALVPGVQAVRTKEQEEV